MSAKEEASKDKKTKKKKITKSEGKTKEEVEEPQEEKAKIKQDETPASVEEKTEKNAVELEEKPADDPLKPQAESIPDSAPAKPTVEDTKKDRRPSKAEEKKGGNKKEKEEIKPTDLEKLVELKEAFSLFDFNHDGIIDLQDLKYTFASMGKPDFPEEEMQKMLTETTDPVDFDAFVALFGYKLSTLDPEDVFTGALATWDMRGVGMIPEERLKRDIRCFGDKFTGKETDFALEEAPVFVNEGTPMIDYVKFGNNICGFKNVEKTRRYQKELESKQAQK